METTALQRSGPQGPTTFAFPVLTKPTGFISTLEGNNTAAEYGLGSPEYLAAKAKWKLAQRVKEAKAVKELQVFTHPDFGSMEIWIGPDGKPWFPATESAAVLKYSNPQKAVRDHCDEKGCTIRSALTSGGTQQKKYINRPNLSRLIARSNLPEAAKFESWIFDDVLESVFDHGGYLTPAKMEEALLNPDVLIQLATNLKAEQAKRRMLEVKVADDAPKVLFADSVAASEDSILVGNLAKLLCQSGVKTGQNRLFEQLRQDGYLCSVYGERRNTPTQKAMEQGLFEVQTHVTQNGDGTPRTRYTTKVTGKGQVYFMNKYGAALAN